MNSRHRRSLILWNFALAFLFVGCATTPPSNFYVLSSPSLETATSAKPGESPTIAVTLISFPDYLSRAQIVRRTSDNSIAVAETHRWAEPLRTNFLRVLLENISILADTPSVIPGPARGSQQVDHTVFIEVSRFDVGSDNIVQLVTLWSINNNRNESVHPTHRSVTSVPVQDDTYDAIAAAHSLAVTELSKDIVDALKQETAN